MRVRSVVISLLSVCAVACGTDESRLPVQRWQDIVIGVETRPGPVVTGMNEFLVSGTRARHRAAYDLLVFIRMRDEDPWVQSIQDGHTGVYRRALNVGGGPQTLQVRIKHAAEETLLRYPLRRAAATSN